MLDTLDLTLLSLLVTLAIAVIGAAGTITVAWITVWPKLREQTVKALRQEIEQLRARVDSLEKKLNDERTLNTRFRQILRLVLTALAMHEPGTVDSIRRDNRDLDL